MILITKLAEPTILTTYRAQTGANYKDMPSDVKIAVKQSLLKEQGNICAYCMIKITIENIKVEHYIPQTIDDTLSLDYNNLLVVCKGNEGQPYERQTCDTHKGNQSLSLNLLKKNDIDTITYSNKGEIKSTRFQDELDNVLNLNDQHGYLIKNRFSVLSTLKADIKKKCKDKSAAVSYMSKLYKRYMEKPDKDSYVGVLLWYLEKRIRQPR